MVKKINTVIITIIITLSLKIHHFPHLTQSEIKTVITLLNLILLVRLLEEEKIINSTFSFILRNKNYLPQKLLLLTAFLSLFVTNDVAIALSTVFTLNVVKNTEFLVALETAMANLASALSPIGNPQNILLVHRFSIPPIELLKELFPFMGLGILLVFLLSFINRYDYSFSLDYLQSTLGLKNYIFPLIYFVIFLLSFLNILPFGFLYILPLTLFFFKKELFKKLNVSSIIFVILLFILTDVIAEILKRQCLNQLLNENVFWTSLLLSQFVGNVPTTFLLSEFSNNWKELKVSHNLAHDSVQEYIDKNSIDTTTTDELLEIGMNIEKATHGVFLSLNIVKKEHCQNLKKQGV